MEGVPVASADTFNSAVSSWTERLKEPWNRLRYSVYHTNLRRHLPHHPLHILDVGGGSGSDAVPLALAGQTVTLVDFAESMLAEARRNAEANNVADRLIFHQADLTELPTLFAGPVFDLVVCHNALQYISDLAGAVQSVCAPLKPEGIVSVVSVNRYSDPYQAALLRLDLDEAFNMLDVQEMFSPVWNTQLYRYSGEEIIAPLEGAGCLLLGHYGVLCVTGYIYDNERKADPEFYAKLERLEAALSDNILTTF